MRVAIMALALAACATPYEGDSIGAQLVTGSWGRGGAEAAPLGGDLWRIKVSLNSYSSFDMVQDYTLLKAAETAKANNAGWFVIEAERDTSSTSSSYTAPQPTSPGSPYMTGGTISNSVSPSGITVVRLLRENGPGAFNADDIITTIGPRVRRR